MHIASVAKEDHSRPGIEDHERRRLLIGTVNGRRGVGGVAVMARWLMTPEQVQQYWDDGFLVGIPVLTTEETRTFRERFEALEAEVIAGNDGKWEDRDFYPWKNPAHPFKDLYEELARLPKLLDAVEAVLGPDLIVRNGDVFIKDPDVDYGVAWHVDTAQRDGTEDGMLTAWLGLGEAPVNELNAGMRFFRGGHRIELPDAPKDKFSLVLSATANKAVDRRSVVQTHMAPGEMSLHHAAMPHVSGYNWGATRRIGFVLRFMTPAVTKEQAEAGAGTLVRGTKMGPFSRKEHFPVTWALQTPEKYRDGKEPRMGPFRWARRVFRRTAVRWRAEKQ